MGARKNWTNQVFNAEIETEHIKHLVAMFHSAMKCRELAFELGIYLEIIA